MRSIILRPVLLLQEDKMPPNFGSDTVSLRLRPRTDFYSSTNVVQDYTDASILNGIATFGGFWTFMDSAFAILFGANILYFLCGGCLCTESDAIMNGIYFQAAAHFLPLASSIFSSAAH
jgi:hypothetical protein